MLYFGCLQDFVAAAATIYQELPFWTRLWTEGQELLHSAEIFRVWIHCNALSNLTEEIQLMGGSNLTHAHSNYFTCMRFIWVFPEDMPYKSNVTQKCIKDVHFYNTKNACSIHDTAFFGL